MKKLYIITEVHPQDAFFEFENDLVGVIVRGNLEEWASEPGWFHGKGSIDYRLVHPDADHDIWSTSFYMIKVKPLQ